MADIAMGRDKPQPPKRPERMIDVAADVARGPDVLHQVDPAVLQRSTDALQDVKRPGLIVNRIERQHEIEQLGAIKALADALDHHLVADAEAEEEPVGIGLGDRLVGGRRGHRVACVDGRDPRGDGDRRTAPQQERGTRERLSAHRLGDPHGAVAEGLELADVLGGLARRDHVEREGPDPVLTDVHPALPLWSTCSEVSAQSAEHGPDAPHHP